MDNFLSIHLGLDPAEEDFLDSDTQDRLDVTDASFVDIIHTDLSFTAIGHVDFFPNGGAEFPQPGCINTTIS